MIKLPPDYRKEISPRRVFFTWDITYKCNYRCSYCHFNKQTGWKEPKVTVNPGTDAWVKVWEGIYKKYGSCEIHFAGGEPFVYPQFMDLIEKLSEMHTLEFSTNLHWDLDDFIKRIKPGRARIGVSYHPEFANFDAFFEKVVKLKKTDFEVWVNYVAYPPQFQQMSNFKQQFEDIGAIVSILPFHGEFEGKQYPEGYDEQQRQHLKSLGNNEWVEKTVDFVFDAAKQKTKDKLCRMGQMYAKIHANGDAYNCCFPEAVKLGNIIEGTFALLEEPFRCSSDQCPCWKGMLLGEEERWANHWVVPPEGQSITNAFIRHKPSVILIQSPPWGVYDPPVGLTQLSACLKQKGFKVRLFDLNIELYRSRKDEYKTIWAIEQAGFWYSAENIERFFSYNRAIIEEWINIIVSYEPKIVGFSVSVASFIASLELSKLIKLRKPGIKIVFGGPMFLVPVNIPEIMKNESIDILVIGEGEETFAELVDLIEKGNSLDTCKGIVYRDGGKVNITLARPFLLNLDTLPFLDFSDLAFDRYDPPGHLGKHISIMASRGCIQNCVYCGPKAYWAGYRSMGGKRIYEELKFHLQNHPEIEHIEFLDLLINGSMRSLDEFCDLMIANGLKIQWGGSALILKEMDASLLRKMAKAGCNCIGYGLESGSQKIIDGMRKGFKIKDAERIIRDTYNAGIETILGIIIGFPGETEDDFKETLKFIERNKDYISWVHSPSECNVSFNNYIHNYPEKFNIILAPNRDGELWYSKDGTNTHEERQRRIRIFNEFLSAVGVKTNSYATVCKNRIGD